MQGMNVVKSHCYLRRVWITKCGSMSLQEALLSIEVALESSHGFHTYATAVLEDVGCSWANFRATLTANTTDPNARLALRLKVSWVYY